MQPSLEAGVNGLEHVLSLCQTDLKLRDRFKAEPKAVLAEFGVCVRRGVHIHVVENSEDTCNLILPPVLEDDAEYTPELFDASLDPSAICSTPSTCRHAPFFEEI